jgi:hypothetical protein
MKPLNIINIGHLSVSSLTYDPEMKVMVEWTREKAGGERTEYLRLDLFQNLNFDDCDEEERLKLSSVLGRNTVKMRRGSIYSGLWPRACDFMNGIVFLGH